MGSGQDAANFACSRRNDITGMKVADKFKSIVSFISLTVGHLTLSLKMARGLLVREVHHACLTDSTCSSWCNRT